MHKNLQKIYKNIKIYKKYAKGIFNDKKDKQKYFYYKQKIYKNIWKYTKIPTELVI